MGFLDKLRNKNQWRYYQRSYGVQVSNLTTAELYETQPNLRAAVSFLADNAAQIPLKIYDRVSDDDRRRVLDSPAALLLSRPNEDMTSFELKRAIYTDMLLYGRSIVLVFQDKETESGWQLRHIPPTWLVDYKGKWAFAPEAIVIGSGFLSEQFIEVPAENFILFHGYSPTNPQGQAAPVRALMDILNEQVESNTFRRQMWQRGGRFNAYLKRPKDVEPWSDEAFERFKETWNSSWAGRNASDAGAMPILEDGMEIAQVQFNSKDAEWTEAKRLGREDVAGVYHFNPALLWPGSGQTYASAKDNARALYNDALAPVLMQVTERLDKFLLPKLSEPSSHYLEYDITIKTEGTFEEKLAAIQAAAGAPILTRNEARAKLNLPALGGGDELITPLNVLANGQLAAPFLPAPLAQKSEPKKYKAAPNEEEAQEIADVLRAFFKRQRNSVLPKLGAEKKKGNIKADEWWDEERWDKELTDALFPIALSQCTAMALKSLKRLGIDTEEYSEARTNNYILAMTEKRARWINKATKDDLDQVEDWEGDPDAYHASYSGVFDYAEEDRAEEGGETYATALAGFAVLEGLRQCDPQGGATKTWNVTSSYPRASHAMMNGETVPYYEPFSNGAAWPGDAEALDPSEVCNCQCTVTVTLP